MGGWNAKQHKEYRQKLLARGICTRCRKRPLMSKGSSVCEHCADANRKFKQRRQDQRLCRDCGGALDSKAVICCFCRELQKARYERLRFL